MESGRAECLFRMLERAAANDEPCPTNPQIAAELQKHGYRVRPGSISSPLQDLVRQGRIVIRLYGGNFRQIVICTGETAGKSTKGPSRRQNPYAIIDAAERARRDSFLKERRSSPAHAHQRPPE
jgi:hypothetical protein